MSKNQCPKCETKLERLRGHNGRKTITPVLYCFKCDDIYMIRLELWEKLRRREIKVPLVKKDSRWIKSSRPKRLKNKLR